MVIRAAGALTSSGALWAETSGCTLLQLRVTMTSVLPMPLAKLLLELLHTKHRRPNESRPFVDATDYISLGVPRIPDDALTVVHRRQMPVRETARVIPCSTLADAEQSCRVGRKTTVPGCTPAAVAQRN